jgi:GTP-binding protein
VLDEDGVLRLDDLVHAGQRFLAARGGRGGRGNAAFATSTRQAPTRHDPGQTGEARRLRLQLRLLADVGLMGFPNTGKSTLISRISAAKPKIADYPFTTLEPHLGVVGRGDFRSFVVADVPGLIEGAHRGAGLGDRFLRHLERCRLLLHLVDPTAERDPVLGIETLDRELGRYRIELAHKPQMLVLTKADVLRESEGIDAVRRHAIRTARPCHQISAVTGAGLEELLRAVAVRLDELGAQPQGSPED